jgi:hypothetical protein
MAPSASSPSFGLRISPTRFMLSLEMHCAKQASVMIEKSARSCGKVPSEFLNLNHTRKTKILVSLLIPKFARDASIEVKRTSESGH